MNYIWIICLILVSILSAYCAKLSNTNIHYGSLYVFLSSLLGVFLWMWVSKTSKNLMFDSILYDIILTITFTSSFIILKCANSFTVYNWIGLILAVLGLLLMKI